NAHKNGTAGIRYLNQDGRDAMFCGYGARDMVTFSQWYTDVVDVNLTISDTLALDDIGGGAYQFESNSFFPLTGRGFGGNDMGGGEGTCHFTSGLRYWFEYGSTTDANPAFDGDDDVWVFSAGTLVVHS